MENKYPIPMTEKLKTYLSDFEIFERPGVVNEVPATTLEILATTTHRNVVNEIARICYLHENNISIRVDGMHSHQAIRTLRDRDDDNWHTKYYHERFIDGGEEFVNFGQNITIFRDEKPVVEMDLDKFFEGKEMYRVSGSFLHSCVQCGSKFYTDISWDVDNRELVVKLEESECFDNTIDHHVELNFKAGDEILFGDWIGGPDFICNLNTDKGLYENSVQFAKHNIGYVFVGNSCPSVYQEGNLLYIGLPKGKKESELTKIGSICTDLWATCFSTARDVIASVADVEEGERDVQIERGEAFLTLEKDTKFKVAIHPYEEYDYIDEDGEEYTMQHYATIEMV